MSALELLSQMREEGNSDGEETRTIAAFIANKLPKAPADMLRLFDRGGSSYSLHGRDAHTVANEYFKSSSAVRYAGPERLAHLTCNRTMGAEIIRAALLLQRRRVEVYGSEKGGGWTLERRGSPGNLQAFEAECVREGDLSVDAAPIIVAVRLGRATAGQVPVGCAFVDATVRAIRVCEFDDDEHLSTLESMLCQQGARECLLPAELADADAARLRDVLELCEVPSTVAKKSAFVAKDADDDLRRLLGVRELHNRALGSTSQLAVSATCGLIKYLDLMASKETHGLWTLDWVDAAQFMRLDAGAMRALSVEPIPGESDRNSSLLGLLSVCKTKVGGRLVRKWLKQPLLSKNDLEQRYDLVDAFTKGFETRSLLRDEVLPKLGSDIDKLGRAFAAKKATLKDVTSLYYFVLAVPKLLHTLKAHAEQHEDDDPDAAELVKSKFTTPLEEVYTNFTNLVRLVQQAVDLDAAQHHEYKLQSHFSDNLADIAEKQDDVRARIDTHHRKLCRDLSMDSDKLRLEIDAKYGYCLRVTRKDEKDLREKAPVKARKIKLSQLLTRKDGVLFHDTNLASYAEEYQQLAKQFNDEQRGLVAKVVETAATFGPVISNCHALVAELDTLLAFAHVSSSAPEPYVRPTLVPPEEGRQRIVLKGCRHPCVERMDAVGYIKNDVELVRGESALQVVTGPNMGGKSTYIRSAGVNVLLAQIGCFVPCDSAEISLVDCILSRVGAGDCQTRGVSTFMAEMLETATILKGATPSSLVIIDELGRGTSTYDGFGLAWAIANHLLAHVGCCTLFATHFHELTSLARTHPQVVNRHVSAHIADGSMTMLYKVEDGPCDRAFGIHVAEVAEFPKQVVGAAKRKLAELEASDIAGADGGEDGGEEGGGKGGAVSTARVEGRSRSALDAGGRAAAVAEVRDFLSAFRALPLDSMGEDKATAAIAELAGALKGSSHPVVAALCPA